MSDNTQDKIVTYVAICLGNWGRGATEEEARKNMVKAGGKKSLFTIIYRNERKPTQDAPYVDDWGCINYYGTNERVAEYNHGKRKPVQSLSQLATQGEGTCRRSLTSVTK